MKLLKNNKKIWLLVSTLSVAVLLLIVLVFNIGPLEKTEVVYAENINQISSSTPIKITIPSIKVDAKVEKVGLTPLGAMDAPQGPDNVGWFSLGVTPGEIGSSVIDGHSGWKGSVPAVFDNLHKLKTGDRIYVENENGQVVIFAVRELKSYKNDASAYEVFNSDDAGKHLNLITCSGEWDVISNSSSERLVVFADLVTN